MSTLDLVVERAVAGGRMLARHDGGIVLVSNAIPGERVRAVVERQSRSITFARATEILERSPSRRDVAFDPSCGGHDYAHIAYDAQLRCKAELVRDAFRRIGRIDIPAPAVAASPLQGYRLRAKLHVRGGRAGFFREGTHEICDAGPTGQLRAESLQAVTAVLERARADAAPDLTGVIVSENVAGTERVLHLERADGARGDLAYDPGGDLPGVSGITTTRRGAFITLAGADHVTDTSFDLFGRQPPFAAPARWRRRSISFFQGNRFLVGGLVTRVLAAASARRVIDLYSGVGLFAVALAASGSLVTAVEGDHNAAADLTANAEPWAALEVLHAPVEHALTRLAGTAPEVVVLDPPRTGASAEALAGLRPLGAARLVYVSCDPPTLARDAARLAADGYRVTAIDAFDLFPNTAHVEIVAVFDRA